MLPSCPSFTKYVTVSVPVSKMVIVFIKYGVKVNGQYYWDILLMPHIQMFDAIKHVVDNSIVFQQNTAPVCNQQGLYHLGGALLSQRRPIASFLSVNQHVMFMRRSLWLSAMRQLRCGNCLELRVLTLTVVICKWLYRDTVFYTKANSSDCPLSYRQHVVRCRCIQNSIQSNCCSAKLSTSFLLSYDPVTVQLLLDVDYTL